MPGYSSPALREGLTPTTQSIDTTPYSRIFPRLVSAAPAARTCGCAAVHERRHLEERHIKGIVYTRACPCSFQCLHPRLLHRPVTGTAGWLVHVFDFLLNLCFQVSLDITLKSLCTDEGRVFCCWFGSISSKTNGGTRERVWHVVAEALFLQAPYDRCGSQNALPTPGSRTLGQSARAELPLMSRRVASRVSKPLLRAEPAPNPKRAEKAGFCPETPPRPCEPR